MNRRQFLTHSGALVAAAGASYWTYKHLNRLPSMSLTKVGLPLAHALRDAQLSLMPAREHHCETLILGSGAAALSAAWWLARHGQYNFVLAEGFERNGNQAAYTFQNDAGSLHAPTGAHYLPQPSTESLFARQLLRDLGIMQAYDNAGSPIYRETDLVHAPSERIWYGNTWQHDFVPPNDADGVRFFQYIKTLNHARGSDGRKLFAIPIALSSFDTATRQLDQRTFAQWLQQHNYQSPQLLWYLDYCCRDDYGQGIDQISAFAGLHYFAARGNDDTTVLTWADGLNQIAEKIRQFIHLHDMPHFPDATEWAFKQPASVPAIAVQIHEHNDHVAVLLRHTRTGETRLVRAKNVICAMPLMVAKRILVDAARYGLMSTGRLPASAPWLVSNFVLHRFPVETENSELAWDNVIQNSSALGYVVATHQNIRVAKPEWTIFTAYTALNHDTPENVRHQLLNAQAHDLIDIAAQDLLTVYGKQFWRAVHHVDMVARAHAMAVPHVGYLSNPLLLSLRQHRSRIRFAHSDLSGYSVFEEANYWGVQAAESILQDK